MSWQPAPHPKFAMRQGTHGWERWDNFSQEWHELPFQYLTASPDAARRYVAAFYGLRPPQVRLES